MENGKMTMALKLAAAGFFVFPVIENGKKPAIEEWQQRATRDPDVIRRWWTAHPLRNIGIFAGRFGDAGKSLLIVDVDDRDGKDGSGTLFALDMRGCTLPPTRTARTRSGGAHLFYIVDEPLGNTGGKLGNGLDTRSGGGYVVGAGSTIDGKAYEWADEREPVPAPAWLIDALGRPRAKADRAPRVELDQPHNIARVIDYFARVAPPAIQGDHGDDRTVLTALWANDYGVSESVCAELMIEHYNPRCIPPWEPEMIALKVASAYKSAQNAPGAKAIDVSDFEPVAQPAEAEVFANPIAPPPPAPFTMHALEPFDGADIPRRRFILDKLALRGKLTVLIAPPGVGKSTETIAWALAVAADRSDVVGMPVAERVPVGLINNEDEEDELKRRIDAVRRYFDIPWPALAGRFFLHSGVERPFLIAKRSASGSIVPADRDGLIDFLVANGIGLLIVDPFVETHRANENDNGEINQVAAYYRRVAIAANCAVIIVHHTRKPAAGSSEGHAGNMDSARGASSLLGVARVAVTLYDMSGDDAKRYGIAEPDRARYVRLDDAKANLSLRSARERWYRREGVRIGNGDEVGVLVPVVLRDRSVDVGEAAAGEIVAIARELGEWEFTLNRAAKLLTRRPMYSDKAGAQGEPTAAFRETLQDALTGGVVVDGHRVECVERSGSGTAAKWFIDVAKIATGAALIEASCDE